MTLADDLKERVRTKAQTVAVLAAVELRTQLREDTPKRTGTTSRGWYTTDPVLVGDSIIEFHVVHPQGPDNPPDPVWLSQGTRPHMIVARNAKVLAFPGRDGGTVFRREVSHPGYAGTGFIERILAPANVSEVWQQAWSSSP